MSNVDNQTVSQLVDTLDRLVSRKGAQVCAYEGYNEKKAPLFVGNKNGYLRLGIEFLKAGIAEPEHSESGRFPVQVEWRYLVSQKSVGVIFYDFVRDDAMELEPTFADPMKMSKTDRLLFEGFFLVVFGVLLFALIGIIAVGWWIVSFLL